MDEIETSLLIPTPRAEQRAKLPDKIDELPSQRLKPALQARIANSFEPNGHEDVKFQI
jgi:hypothetical protein